MSKVAEVGFYHLQRQVAGMAQKFVRHERPLVLQAVFYGHAVVVHIVDKYTAMFRGILHPAGREP